MRAVSLEAALINFEVRGRPLRAFFEGRQKAFGGLNYFSVTFEKFLMEI